MLMVSIRFQKIKQILKLILVILLIVLAVVLIKGWIGTGDDAPKEPSAQNVDAVKPSPKMLPQEYLKCCGWEIDSQAVEVCEVIIPQEFDETFESYNELQKLQGMDLSRYKGQRAKRYTYTVLNYPGQEEGVQANVLVLNDTIIGGDVSSVAIDGFMHGFAIPDDY